jgi:hypothetical protein
MDTRVKQPEPGTFSSARLNLKEDDLQSVDLKKQFSESGLQVIVKLEYPSYSGWTGGTWHVEG